MQFSGYGTLNTWGEPNQLAQTIQQGLIANGWGVSSVNVTNVPSILSGLLSWKYLIEININAAAGDDPNRIASGLNNYLSGFFNNAELTLIGNPNNPQTITNNVQAGIAATGNAIDTVNKLADAVAPTIFGLSVASFALLAVAGIIIIPKLINSNPTRYRFR